MSITQLDAHRVCTQEFLKTSARSLGIGSGLKDSEDLLALLHCSRQYLVDLDLLVEGGPFPAA